MIIDPANTPASDVYRAMIRSVVPRPIAWVSSVSADGTHNLAPFSFFMAISADPPTLAFAPGRRSRDGGKKDTLRNIEETGEFVVNVVGEDLAEEMNETATDYPDEVSEFVEAGLTPVPGDVVRAPRVAESPVNFECRKYDIIPVGPDGTGGAALVIGEVVRIHIDERVLREGKIDPELLRPIGRLGGMEYTRTRDRFVMVRKKLDSE